MWFIYISWMENKKENHQQQKNEQLIRRDTQHSHQKENFCTAEQKVFDCTFAIATKKKRKVFNSIMDDVSNWCCCIA